MEKVYIFLAEGFEEIEALTVVDILRRAQIETKMVSVEEELAVRGSHGILVTADLLFDGEALKDAAVYVLPGGMPGTRRLGEHAGLARLLEEAKGQGRYLAAICAAPTVLGRLGLLQGEKAICYPGMEEQLAGAQVVVEPVVVSGKVITSRGMGTALPFALRIQALLQGEEAAREMARKVVFQSGDFAPGKKN